jgi:hypothetical protein
LRIFSDDGILFPTYRLRPPFLLQYSFPQKTLYRRFSSSFYPVKRQTTRKGVAQNHWPMSQKDMAAVLPGKYSTSKAAFCMAKF